MRWRPFLLALPVAAGCALTPASPPPAIEPVAARIRDDVRVQHAVEEARAQFLAGQRFDRLDATVLLAAPGGLWLRGSVGGDRTWYPASCVKLGFAIAATHWCAAHSRGPDCLDQAVRPMLEVSDNVATGVVVDAITGVTNGPVEGADFEAWLARRLYTEDLLKDHGLLGNQRLVNKTYPTNTGEMPQELEKLAVERHGRNSMTADGSARLMLAVVSGEFGPAATDYLRLRLRRPRISPESAMGGGFPEGTVYESKFGSAYDTLAEIAHAELPDGRRIIIAAYSNGRDPDGPDEQDPSALAGFAALLLERLTTPQAGP
ncbi:MAG: serine hydrolase [Steroidobacteraceae bacterium]